jgi:hypothetical protein
MFIAGYFGMEETPLGYKYFVPNGTFFRDPNLDDSNWRQLNLPHDWRSHESFKTNQQAFHGMALAIIQSKGQAENQLESEWLDLSDRGG